MSNDITTSSSDNEEWDIFDRKQAFNKFVDIREEE